MTITELSIKRPSLIIVIFTVLILMGLFSFNQLSYELLPKISPPVIVIITTYPGASPDEVETSVTKIIEDAVSGQDQVTTVNATSSENVSLITVEFSQSVNIDFALQDAQRRVNQVIAKLPNDIDPPTLLKIALDEIPILRLGTTSTLPPNEFRTFLNDFIKPELAQVKGVAQINFVGGEEREIKILLNEERLKSYNLSIGTVTQIIKSANLDFPAGSIKDADGQFIVRVAGKFRNIDDVRNLTIIRTPGGSDILLSDVAEVVDGVKEFTQQSRINGVPSVGVQISKQSDANAVEVAKNSKQVLLDLEKQYKNIELKFDIAQDGSLFTITAADAVKFDLAVAVVLVALVMLLFLHSFRNSVIVLIAIPSSLISTFIAIYAFGFTLNLMTLLALSLVVGILVDDSIVVLENIYHHLEKGEDRRVAALKGRNEIGFAALSITLVDVAVFLPLALVTGIVGNILRQFSLVVVVSTLMSLIVSFTITPMLASRFSNITKFSDSTLFGRFVNGFERGFKKVTGDYLVLLQWGLNHKMTVFFVTTVLLIGSLSLVPLGFIGSEFMTVADRGEFTVVVDLPVSTNIKETNFKSMEIEKLIATIPEVKKVYTTVGSSSMGLIGQSSNYSISIDVTLSPRKERSKSTDQISEEIRQKLNVIPGYNVRVNPIGIFGAANQTPIMIVVSGANLDSVQVAAEKLADLVQTVPGTADVRLSSEQGNKEISVKVDRKLMAGFGLTLAEVAQTLRIAFTGDDNTKFRDGRNEFDIRIQLDEYSRNKTSALGEMVFTSRTGKQVKLSQFATLESTTGPSKLTRTDRNSAIYVYSQAVGRPTGSIAQDIDAKRATATFPEGVNFAYMGDVKMQGESFSSMLLALTAAILFVYLIMVALYDNWVYPFVVLFSIPVAMVGALLALAMTMKALSIFSMLGVVMLVGLVAKNAILLVDRASQMKIEQNVTSREALLEAGRSRLRPIIMTTLTMIMGMVPIAISTSDGSEWKSGLAWAIIGGLSSSLLLTLVLVPVVYELVDSVRDKIKRRFGKKEVLA
ncbi:MAG: efflux RND transporter permease subunit [Ignavibacteriaceae bacterium]|jgi:HAE1 family hydrophobic/amphiphilic exporter-1|nr:efflux RND transporter permease subunit [Ignavibacteriaceae bacterium]